VSLRNPALPFFLLPFFLLAGVALQSAGLYLCLVLWIFSTGQGVGVASRRAILSTASLLAIAYLIPVVLQSIVALSVNPLQFCFVDPPRVTKCHVDLKSWLKSPVSTTFLGLSVGWTIYVLSGKVSSSKKSSQDFSSLNVWNDDNVRLRGFANGLLYSSAILFVYCLFQHVTGFNVLLKTKMLADEHRMPNGNYRVFGFYGHPLSLASGSLVWSIMALFGLWSIHKKRSDAFGLNAIGWGIIAVLHSALVYMSGGRTALLVLAIFWAILIVVVGLGLMSLKLKMSRRKFFNTKNRIPILLGVIPAVIGVFSSVVYLNRDILQAIAGKVVTRGVGGGTLGQGPLGDRELFWQVYLAMWRDAPMLGQGYFAVEHGLRTHYYVQEGFAGLRDKFNAHNIFLEVLGTTGLIGFFGYLLVCVLLWVNMKVLAGRSEQRRFIVGALGCAFLANLLHGLTQNTFFDSAVSACYLALIGILVVPPLKPRSEID
jgi:O-antigen ligase